MEICGYFRNSTGTLRLRLMVLIAQVQGISPGRRVADRVFFKSGLPTFDFFGSVSNFAFMAEIDFVSAFIRKPNGITWAG